MKKRNRFKRLYQRTGDPIFRGIKNELTSQIRKLQFEIKNESWNKKLQHLNIKDNSLWKFAKIFTKTNDNKIPPLRTPNGLATADAKEADALADHYESVHYFTKDMGSPEFDRQIEKNFERIMKKSA